jgi:hypothetical protein
MMRERRQLRGWTGTFSVISARPCRLGLLPSSLPLRGSTVTLKRREGTRRKRRGRDGGGKCASLSLVTWRGGSRGKRSCERQQSAAKACRQFVTVMGSSWSRMAAAIFSRATGPARFRAEWEEEARAAGASACSPCAAGTDGGTSGADYPYPPFRSLSVSLSPSPSISPSLPLTLSPSLSLSLPPSISFPLFLSLIASLSPHHSLFQSIIIILVY